MKERIKELEEKIRLARTQNSAVSENINETGHVSVGEQVNFIGYDSHWHIRRVKEAIHSRLHPNFINRDNGIVTPKAWMPTIKKHNSGSITKRTPEGTTL